MSCRVVHFEIPFDDGDRARSFYAEAFGWELAKLPELDYTIATTGPQVRPVRRPSRATSTVGWPSVVSPCVPPRS